MLTGMDRFDPRAPHWLMDRRFSVGGDRSLRSPISHGMVDRRVYVDGDRSLLSPGTLWING